MAICKADKEKQAKAKLAQKQAKLAQKELERRRLRLEKLVRKLNIYARLCLDMQARSVVLYVGNDEITFDNLSKLSELFQTKKINIGSDVIQDQYYGSGGGVFTEVCIHILDVDFNILKGLTNEG